ncbi:hypothetical protein ACHAXT_000895 [Thalassiosira profunda]
MSRPAARLIDGPQLPHLHNHSPGDRASSLVPLLAPPITSTSDGSDDGSDGRRYLLVPSPERIVVRSAANGRRLGELGVPGGDIRAVCVARLPRVSKEEDDEDSEFDEGEGEGADGGDEWVVLAGCKDGRVHEWAGAGLSHSLHQSEGGAKPRRSWKLACDPLPDVELAHLTSVSGGEDACQHLPTEGATLYALLSGQDADTNESARLVRCAIPPFAPTAGEAPLPATPLAAVRHVPSKSFKEAAAKNDCVCLKARDAVFDLKAAYRPSDKIGGDRGDYATGHDGDADKARGDVLVALASAHSVAVYRDSVQPSADDEVVDPSTALVHLTRALKPPPLYTRDQTALCALALSPGAADLALGRASGHIDILDGVFSNVISYLDGIRRKDEDVVHPADATVRRTVHWHAHPVRALAYAAATRGGNRSLLSGGEESVLVEWQLERNSHRPSNTIARISAAGIVHVLRDASAGKVVAFCADHSIQCFDATNYERAWAVQGLAATALHPEDPEGGPVIAVRDPITGHPMLANLPGAPGMIHWYDPAAAEVAGTLEVAPFNRVSRRDPTVDPHVPAPAVTHVAVGADGRDLVTVDVTWTENASVGRAAALKAPRGTVQMSVCTSVKFWAYGTAASAEGRQRKRRAGDVPMNYALASSMASPHGRNGGVCALAVAPGGDVACTLSREEGAFRVWAKHPPASAAGGAGATPWKCRYRVQTPAGYANLLSNQSAANSFLARQLVSFSSDGSVLAVTYGPRVTLWDHSGAALLTSLTQDAANAGDEDDVTAVHFLTKDDDVVLLSTERRLDVQSPCGKANYLGTDAWGLDAASLGNGARISAVAPLRELRSTRAGARGCFAAAFAMDGGSRSEVVVVRKDEGSVLCAEGTDVPLRWTIDGAIQCLCAGAGPNLQLLAVTADGRMLSLRGGAETKARKGGAASEDGRARAPVLRVGSVMAEARSAVKRRKVTLVGAAADRAAGASGFDFPRLSGRFTSAFVAQSLSR